MTKRPRIYSLTGISMNHVTKFTITIIYHGNLVKRARPLIKGKGSRIINLSPLHLEKFRGISNVRK